MASLVIGGALGYFFGPLGFLAGSAVGALLDPQKGPQISDLHLQGSTYGAVIPICYGTMRVAGQVIWTTELHPHQGKGKGGLGPEVTTYTASFDVLICEGPILGVQRIWADGTLIYDTTGTVTGLPSLPVVFYTGGESQLPDPTEEAAMGTGFVPAYRGYARAVFTELDLTNYGNSLPRLTFQVFSEGGQIPWRVSSFDVRVGQPTVISGCSYSNGLITASLPYGADCYASQWTPQGTQIGPTVITAYGGNQPVPITGVNVWAFLDPSNIYWHWGTIDPVSLISSDLGLIGSDGLGPYTAPQQLGGNNPVYCNGYIYTVGNTSTQGTLGQWACPSGLPGSFVASYSFTNETILSLGSSDTNQLYVLTENTITTFKTLWRFVTGSGFTLDTSWNHTALAGTNVLSSTGNNFFVYQDIIAMECVVGSLTFLGLTQISGGGLANTGVRIATAGSRPGYLGQGLGIDTDGVFSLFPPSGPVELSVIVADIATRCGLASDQYDVTALTDEVPGYLITNQSTGRDNIMELRTAYFFDAVESSAVLNFVKRGGPSELSIADNDLAAQVGHTGTPPPLALVERAQEVDLPATTYVVFIDPNDQYLNGTQYARRLVTNSQTVATVQLAVALTVQTARAVAQLLLFTAWLERNTVTFILSRQYATIEPTDVFTAHGYTIRVTDKTYVASNLIQLKGVVTNTGAFIAGPGGAVSGGSPSGPPSSQTQSPTNLLLLNLPLIIDTDYAYGPYCAMAGSSAVLPWGGGTLYESTDGGVTYNSVANSAGANVMGVATTALGNFTGGNIFDKTNTVTVVIGNGGGTLASATEAAVLNGANIAYLGSGSGSGGEVFQFASAQLIATNTYVLSDLLRGRRGTEWQIGQHAAGEIFCLLPCVDINGPFTDLGNSRLFKGVSVGQPLAAVTAQSFINTGETLRCYSPYLLYSSVDGSGNVTMYWTRRTRIGGAWAEFTDVPLSEEFEQYVVQIWDSTFTICAHVFAPGFDVNQGVYVPAPGFIYTDADQMADFGQLEQDIFVSIGQVGTFGLGIQSFATFPGGGSSNVTPLHPVAPYNTGAPMTTPPVGCVGTPLTGPAGNAFTWAAEWQLPSGSFPNTDYWLLTIPVPSSPVNGLCKVTITNLSGGALAAGSISATLSSVPNCGPAMIPAVNVAGVSSVAFNFSIGPSPNPATAPQLLPSTTYYLAIKTSVSQPMAATLYTQG